MKSRIQKTLHPGHAGTKRWYEKYGTKLVAVRYRTDRERMRKLTTVEIIVEEKEWQRELARIPPNKKVYVRVDYGERELGRKVRQIGGVWKRDKKLWKLTYKKVLMFDLLDRMIEIEE